MAKKSMKKQLQKQRIRSLMEKRKKRQADYDSYATMIIDSDYYGTTVDASEEDYELFNYQKEI